MRSTLEFQPVKHGSCPYRGNQISSTYLRFSSDYHITIMANRDLHSRYNTLTMLLTLVTAVNNGGYPTLHHSDRESARAQQEDVDRRTRNSILNAVAALLVQDHEIIAIASHDSSERMGQTEDQPEDQQPDEPQQDQGPRVPYPATHEEEHSFNVNS